MDADAGQVKVFLPEGAPAAEVERIMTRARAMDGVRAVRFVPAAEARKKAEQMFKDDKDAPTIPPDTFTDSIEVTPTRGADTQRIFAALAEETGACEP